MFYIVCVFIDLPFLYYRLHAKLKQINCNTLNQMHFFSILLYIQYKHVKLPSIDLP